MNAAAPFHSLDAAAASRGSRKNHKSPVKHKTPGPSGRPHPTKQAYRVSKFETESKYSASIARELQKPGRSSNRRPKTASKKVHFSPLPRGALPPPGLFYEPEPYLCPPPLGFPLGPPREVYCGPPPPLHVEAPPFVHPAMLAPPLEARPLPMSSPIRNRSPLRPRESLADLMRLPETRVMPVDDRRFMSPMKNESEDAIVGAILEGVELERSLEHAKNDCAGKLDFNIPDAFRVFDLNMRGFITAVELKDGLGDLGIYATFDDAELILNRYNRSGTGRLTLKEFEEAVLPLDPYYEGVLIKRRGSSKRVNPYRRDDIFAHGTASNYVELLRMHLKVEMSVEGLRQRISRNPFFKPIEAFAACDMNRSGLVTRDELRLFLETRGIFLSTTEVHSVARRFDKNLDGIITLAEFQSELRPKSPSRRVY